MGVGSLDDLAVHFKDEAHHTMGRRMLRPEIHHVVLDMRRAFELVCRRRPLLAHTPPSLGVSPAVGSAFSSPGRILSIPSHGDRKSKLRNSCCNFTDS